MTSLFLLTTCNARWSYDGGQRRQRALRDFRNHTTPRCETLWISSRFAMSSTCRYRIDNDRLRSSVILLLRDAARGPYDTVAGTF